MTQHDDTRKGKGLLERRPVDTLRLAGEKLSRAVLVGPAMCDKCDYRQIPGACNVLLGDKELCLDFRAEI